MVGDTGKPNEWCLWPTPQSNLCVFVKLWGGNTVGPKGSSSPELLLLTLKFTTLSFNFQFQTLIGLFSLPFIFNMFSSCWKMETVLSAVKYGKHLNLISESLFRQSG